MANMIGRLGVVLGLDSAEFVRGIEIAGKQLEKLSHAAETYGKIAGAAMVAAGLHALQYADELNDVAKANDVTIDSVLKLQKALAVSGGSAENAGKMFAGFTQFVDKAAQGGAEAQAKFAKIGISLQDLSKLSSEQLFTKALEGLSKVNDPLTRYATSMSMFGKAVKGVDIKGLNDEFQSNNALIKEQAERIEKAAQVWDKLKKSALDASTTIAIAIGPTLLTTIEYIEKLRGESNLLGTAFETVLQTVVITGNTVLMTFKAVWDEIVHTYENAKTLVTKGIDAAIQENKRYDLYIEGQRKARIDFENKILGIETYPEKNLATSKAKKETGTAVAGRPVEDANAKRIAQLKAEQEMLLKMRDIDKARGDIAVQMVYNKEDELKIVLLALQYSADIFKIEEERKKAIAENVNKSAEVNALINRNAEIKKTTALEKYQSEVAKTETERKLKAYDDERKAEEDLGKWQSRNEKIKREMIEDEQRAVQLINERLAYENSLYLLMPQERDLAMQRYDLEAKITEFMRQQERDGISPEEIEQRSEALRRLGEQTIELNKKTIEQQETFKYGWETAYQSYIEHATNAATIAGEAFNSIIGNMNSAIDNFVRNGKFSFRDFARSVLQDLTAIQMKSAAAGIFSNIASGVGGLVKTMMGGGSNIGSVLSGVPSGMAMADGGTPPVGLATLVGERGPELFVPKSSGTVIPNNQLSSVMGDGGQTINYNGPYIANMSAIDTQSGIQFLAKNKQTIWASYQSANRSVPVSR